MLEFDSRRFVDIFDIHTRVIPTERMTCYEVGKLAFNLLPILLSSISEGPVVSMVHNMLLCFPPFYLIKNDLLRLEKVKAMQAIEEFLKV